MKAPKPCAVSRLEIATNSRYMPGAVELKNLA